MRRRLSRWCRPIDGSSSTYSTPGQPRADLRREADALRLAARRAMPADAAEAEVVRGRPGAGSPGAARISRSTCAAIFASRSVSSSSGEVRLGVGEAQVARHPRSSARARAPRAPRASAARRCTTGHGTSRRYSDQRCRCAVGLGLRRTAARCRARRPRSPTSSASRARSGSSTGR